MGNERRFFRLILLGLIVLWGLSACGSPRPKGTVFTAPSLPERPPAKGLKPYKVGKRTYYPLSSAQGYTEEGLASWYGPKFHGKRTASGEVYNMYAFTAAHKILPLGTHVLVTNLENGRQVVVRINDRGPFVPGRIIDLSYAAARALGMVEEGVVPVRIVALAEGQPTPQGVKWLAKPDFKHGEFYLQVGAFKSYFNAQRFRSTLARRYSKVIIEPFRQAGQTFYRVRIFLARDLDQARLLAQRLKALFPESFLVAK